MRKILANEEQDYFNLYLKVNEDDSGELYDKLEYFVEQFKELKKPIKYPCIIIYNYYSYYFVYESDFQNFTEQYDDQ